MMVLMFQREVAERIIARVDDDAYGRLAVLANWRAETRRSVRYRAVGLRAAAEGDVVGRASGPAPRPARRATRRALERVTAAAFGQRRKMLRQSLKSLGVDAASPWRPPPASTPPQRAETVPISGFVAMAREIIKMRNEKLRFGEIQCH